MNISAILWIIILASLLLIISRFFNKPQIKNTDQINEKFISANIQTESGSHEYKLEVADTNEKRTKGLMHVSEMPQKQGMLFIFDMTGIYPFWMKNTLIPLDIIWLDSDKKVVYIKENAQPCSNIINAICQSMTPLKVARYVVELNSGQVDKINLKLGDQIEF